MEIVRKGGTAAAGIILAVLIICDILFMDAIAGGIIQKAGEKIFKAKVSIAKTDVRFTKGRIILEGVTVADKNSEYKNLFAFDKAGIEIDILPLLTGKVIIDNIAVENMALGTKRKTSGLLKSKPDNDALSKEIEKTNKEHTGVVSGSDKNSGKPQIPEPKELNSYKEIIAQQELAKNRVKELEDAVKNADIKGRTDKVSKQALELKDIKVSSVADIKKAKDALAEIENLKKEVSSIKSDAGKMKIDAQIIYSMKETSKREVQKAVDKDVQEAMAKAGLSSLDAEGVLKALVGPSWYGVVDKGNMILKYADKFITPGNKSKKQGFSEMQRGVGSFILFGKGKYPDFWIKEIRISGSGSDMDSMYASGSIKNITTQQHITGKPTTANISAVKSEMNYGLTAVINRITGINDSINVAATGLPLSVLGMQNKKVGDTVFKNAKINFNMSAGRINDITKISGKVGFDDVEFDGGDFSRVMNSLGSFNVMFRGATINDKSEFDVSSDAFDKLASKAGNAASEEVKKQILSKISGEKAGMLSSIGSSTDDAQGVMSQVTKSLDSVDAEIEKAKKELTKKATGGIKIF